LRGNQLGFQQHPLEEIIVIEIAFRHRGIHHDFVDDQLLRSDPVFHGGPEHERDLQTIHGLVFSEVGDFRVAAPVETPRGIFDLYFLTSGSTGLSQWWPRMNKLSGSVPLTLLSGGRFRRAVGA